jgi:hypothetical protein
MENQEAPQTPHFWRWWLLGVLFFCGCLFGFGSMVVGIWNGVSGSAVWCWENAGTLARLFCWFALIVLLVVGWKQFEAWCEANTSQGAANDNFGAMARPQFKDGSAYGDADLADRETIARAMNGHNDRSAPIFEE